VDGEKMLFVLQQAAHVNPRDDSWEHAVLWIVLALVLVVIFLLAYFAFRFGWFKRDADRRSEGEVDSTVTPE
jgi:heme/copper-type cytochrome/quinol oxidase subunit 2